MATLVFFHAHPDDESSQTAGMMALAVQKGHRVFVVYGTNGCCGEKPKNLKPGQTLVDVRKKEAENSAKVVGTKNVFWLGYDDSGMTGWEQNQNPAAFLNADLSQAGLKLAKILDQVDADGLISYDWHGNYGHPDHIQVHRVGKKALQLVNRKLRYFEASMNRDARKRLGNRSIVGDDGNPIGTPEAELTWAVDVSSVLEIKRAAMQCHVSQTSDIGFFLSLTPKDFQAYFGTEYLIEPNNRQPLTWGWPFEF